MPDFRSAERTFQLLTQVAGRAGRGERRGRVIIQTYAPHHYSIRAARDQDYSRFMRRELDLQRELTYPPFARMAMVRIEGEDSTRVGQVAEKAAAILDNGVRVALSGDEASRADTRTKADLLGRERVQLLLGSLSLSPRADDHSKGILENGRIHLHPPGIRSASRRPANENKI